MVINREHLLLLVMAAVLNLGPTETNESTTLLRILTNNLSFENRTKGFDQNAANCQMNIYNNSCYNNGTSGDAAYSFGYNLGTTINSKNNLNYTTTGSSNYAGYII